MYVTDVLSSVVTPNTRLVGFLKTDEIKPGQSTKVTVPVRGDELGLWSMRNQWVVEPGAFVVRVGASDLTYANATLTVV